MIVAIKIILKGVIAKLIALLLRPVMDSTGAWFSSAYDAIT